MQCVWWLHVSTSGSYSWGYSQSEISHEHTSIPSGYGATDVSNSRWFEPHIKHQSHSYVLNNLKHNYKCASSVTGTSYFKQYVEYLNEQFPDQWIGHGDPQNWPVWLPDLASLDFHGKRVWAQREEKKGMGTFYICLEKVWESMKNLRTIVVLVQIWTDCFTLYVQNINRNGILPYIHWHIWKEMGVIASSQKAVIFLLATVKTWNFTFSQNVFYYCQFITFYHSVLCWSVTDSASCQILRLCFWHPVWIVCWHCWLSSQKKCALISPNCSSFLVCITTTQLWWNVSVLNISTFSCWVHL
jgi:hypothetical protein